MICSICKMEGVLLYGIINGRYSSTEPTDGSGVACKTCYGEVNNIINCIKKRKRVESISYPADNKWGKRFIEEVVVEKSFLCDLADTFREGIHSDIQVKPGSGHPIPAHKFILATRSEILKTMLASATFKVAPTDSISLPEFNHEELKTLLEFLYVGNLAKEKVEKHCECLLIAADKYMIPHLQKFCEQQMVNSLDSSNALTVLEMSEVVPNETLKLAALESILQHKHKIFNSPDFEEFAKQKPHLMVQISRASLTFPQ